MTVELGHFAVVIALVLSVVGISTPMIGLKSRNGTWVVVGRRAVIAAFVMLTIGMATLFYAYLTEDYTVKYVAATSNSKLPIFYKIAGLWGGHEGSLLLWAWILSLYCMLAVIIHWKSQPVVMPYLIMIESIILCGFLLLILFLSNPFERNFPAPLDGRDLNPLLQDPAMVVHPPLLYVGYVGLSIPFAFAMAALFSGRLGEEWIKATQRWTVFSWMALTLGIGMGGFWAYYELGWGGYWGWDPVENAAFMPWLVTTAFLHSTMVQEKRKMFKVWNLFLSILAFSLSLIGMFLVRSGVLSSVHSFAADPGRGIFILGFLVFMLLLSFGTLILRSGKLRSTVKLESMVSRESIFLVNNLFFLVALATVFVGTLYPLLMEVLELQKVSVGAPYYNAVFMPVALGLIFLMGVGPYIPWRKSTPTNIKKLFVRPLLIAVGALPLIYIFGVQKPYALAGLSVVIFVLSMITMDFNKVATFWAKRQKVNRGQGLVEAYKSNPRRISGIIIHLGVIILVIGVIFSSMYQAEKILIMKPGEEVTIKSFRFRMASLYSVEGINWGGKEALFDVYEGGEIIAQMNPQKRFYTVSQTPTTETAIYQLRMGHLFVTIPEVAPDGTWARVRILHNPLVTWVWAGGVLMAIGAFMNILRKTRRKRSPASESTGMLPEVTQKVAADVTAGAVQQTR